MTRLLKWNHLWIVALASPFLGIGGPHGNASPNLPLPNMPQPTGPYARVEPMDRAGVFICVASLGYSLKRGFISDLLIEHVSMGKKDRYRNSDHFRRAFTTKRLTSHPELFNEIEHFLRLGIR